MSKNTTNFFPISKKRDVIVQEFPSETMVYDLVSNRAYLLNQTCSLVFSYADGKTSISEISRLMSNKLNSKVSEDFVWLTLNELKGNGLLEDLAELNYRFAGLSRREIVKRIGVTSMIALPIISSIVAPNSANAQSNTGITCTTMIAGGQGTCPSNNLRCVNSVCVECVPTGSPTPGGCTLADLSGARQCCSNTCSLTTSLCST